VGAAHVGAGAVLHVLEGAGREFRGEVQRDQEKRI
jgi:hypothetical protein